MLQITHHDPSYPMTAKRVEQISQPFSHLNIRIQLPMVLVQIYAWGAARSMERSRLCGENRIPDCRDSLVLETEPPQGELSFANAAEQFDTGDGGSCAIKVLEAEHRPCSGFTVIPR